MLLLLVPHLQRGRVARGCSQHHHHPPGARGGALARPPLASNTLPLRPPPCRSAHRPQLDVEPTLVDDILFYATPTLGALRPTDLCNLLWSLSQLRARPRPAFQSALFSAAEPLLPHLRREEVPLVLYALARLQARTRGSGGRGWPQGFERSLRPAAAT
jgi:hypothetical protein